MTYPRPQSYLVEVFVSLSQSLPTTGQFEGETETLLQPSKDVAGSYAS